MLLCPEPSHQAEGPICRPGLGQPRSHLTPAPCVACDKSLFPSEPRFSFLSNGSDSPGVLLSLPVGSGHGARGATEGNCGWVQHSPGARSPLCPLARLWSSALPLRRGPAGPSSHRLVSRRGDTGGLERSPSHRGKESSAPSWLDLSPPAGPRHTGDFETAEALSSLSGPVGRTENGAWNPGRGDRVAHAWDRPAAQAPCHGHTLGDRCPREATCGPPGSSEPCPLCAPHPAVPQLSRGDRATCAAH